MTDRPHDGAHDGPHEEAVGSVAEEAAKLFGALSGSFGGWSEHAHAVDEHLATGAAECTFCPICRTVHALRSASPEVKTQLATAGQSLLSAAAALLAAATQPPQEPPTSVQHIDLDDDADDDPEDEGPL